MCSFANSENNRKRYLIGGYIIQSDIPIKLLRENLSKYEVISKPGQKVDLDITIKADNSMINSAVFVGMDNNSGNGLEYCIDDEIIIYKNVYNRIVKYCRVIRSDNYYKLEIMIDDMDSLINSSEISAEYISDITYSMRDGVYIFLNVKGNLCLHSCGLIVDDEGVLIIGTAGSGKTYYSNLFFSPNDDDFVGEDINVCSIEDDNIKFMSTPWCRKNNNKYSIAKTIIIIETNGRKIIEERDIYSILSQSEFSFSWLPGSKERIKQYSTIIVNNGYTVIFNNK